MPALGSLDGMARIACQYAMMASRRLAGSGGGVQGMTFSSVYFSPK